MENNKNTSICSLITELVKYGCKNNLIETDDEIYCTNRLLELFNVSEYIPAEVSDIRSVNEILDDIISYALSEGILEDDTITSKDLFDTKIMGLITPPPSAVRKHFREKYEISPRAATDFYYSFSQATNYIRTDRIKKDEKWVFNSEYGPIDITINLSKPEKDPRDIAKAGQTKKSGYPSCLLCKENEGYAGHFSHPARNNHRVIPLKLANEDYYLQYSPYVYYNEHCIIFNDKHIPMVINKDTFVKLLDFVAQFPHYTAGSNADLPIVGGSILSHDHFQGGGYTFAMARAPYEYSFEMEDFKDVTAGIIKWPMSVIRLKSKNPTSLAEASDHILKTWRIYTDEDAFIYAYTDGTPHNTITPIARIQDDMFEMDLVLRNNITTEECPWGVYHPTEDLHHIKKENIGLIEVMGLAVLPSRLKKEIEILEDAILTGKDINSIEEIKKHAAWAGEWLPKYDNLTSDNIDSVVKEEIGKVFVKVLECAGVYKRDEAGKASFLKFIESL